MRTTERVAAFAACFLMLLRGVRSTNEEDVPVRPIVSAYCQRFPRPRRLPVGTATAVPFIMTKPPGGVGAVTFRAVRTARTMDANAVSKNRQLHCSLL